MSFCHVCLCNAHVEICFFALTLPAFTITAAKCGTEVAIWREQAAGLWVRSAWPGGFVRAEL